MLCCPTVGVSSPTGASRKLNPQLEAWASPQPKWPPASQRATTTQPLATASRKTTTSRSQMDSPSQQLTPPPRPSADQLSSSLGGCGRPAAPTCSRTLCEAVLQLSGALPLSELLCCLTWQCHGSSGHRRSWVGSALASRLGTGSCSPAQRPARMGRRKPFLRGALTAPCLRGLEPQGSCLSTGPEIRELWEFGGPWWLRVVLMEDSLSLEDEAHLLHSQ
ncbi:uncharacterized protein [Macaca nemestrina]|uniref:uncharacterized protein isoform X2 n=1 Tax=Macaca nemestrina TaxID=9545 RepID=UPI0039B8DF2F